MKVKTIDGMEIKYIEVYHIKKVDNVYNSSLCPCCGRLIFEMRDNKGKVINNFYRCFICGIFKERNKFKAKEI